MSNVATLKDGRAWTLARAGRTLPDGWKAWWFRVQRRVVGVILVRPALDGSPSHRAAHLRWEWCVRFPPDAGLVQLTKWPCLACGYAQRMRTALQLALGLAAEHPWP